MDYEQQALPAEINVRNAEVFDVFMKKNNSYIDIVGATGTVITQTPEGAVEEHDPLVFSINIVHSNEATAKVFVGLIRKWMADDARFSIKMDRNGIISILNEQTNVVLDTSAN